MLPKPTPVKPDATQADPVKSEPAKPDPVKPEPKPDAALVGPVKTIPSDPPLLTDKIELPSGGVRLLVKASDPYGGKLLFQWKQVKGAQVEIVDPTAAKFLDGKWVSQTYFVAPRTRRVRIRMHCQER